MLFVVFLAFIVVVLLVERHFRARGMLDDPREGELKDLGSWWDTSYLAAAKTK